MVNVKLGKEMKKDEIIMSQTWDKNFLILSYKKKWLWTIKYVPSLPLPTIIPQVRNACNTQGRTHAKKLTVQTRPTSGDMGLGHKHTWKCWQMNYMNESHMHELRIEKKWSWQLDL